MSTPQRSQALALLPDKGLPELLFLLLHGAGADAAQMRPLAQALRAQYPQAAVVSINGPEAFDQPSGSAQSSKGQQWYSLQGASDDDHPERVAAALPGFVATVRAWAEQFDMAWERVALAGFSQGAVMALEAVQAEPQLAGRVLAFSGAYARPPAHAPDQVSLHILHGQRDPVLPYQDQVTAARRLVQLGADVTADVLPDLGHELHAELIDRAMEQLRTFVPARVWKAAMEAAKEQKLD
ncbi:esterase [Paucibacter sp. DJ2R-2]|uniref:esterase n=1 Tax=Paucibacter sp. DJ2R-2 TaxID=2893558 RepID=UPI0021E36592|nr:esterase [Paucibacter sp. DJ2R-2]MCV2419570.1 esterase [Paucibacter sp. DJ4R-1]MCV2437527.1 esterase [Paucibacter sp. DJ2R-2]